MKTEKIIAEIKKYCNIISDNVLKYTDKYVKSDFYKKSNAYLTGVYDKLSVYIDKYSNQVEKYYEGFKLKGKEYTNKQEHTRNIKEHTPPTPSQEGNKGGEKEVILRARGVFGKLSDKIKVWDFGSIFSGRNFIVTCIAFIILDISLIWLISNRVLYAKYYWEGPDEKKMFIKPGKNFDEIIAELKQTDVVRRPLIFKLLVKISGKEDKIISKRYLFKNGISNSELLTLLTDRNMTQTEKFTLFEGIRIKQIAKAVENKLQLSREKFIEETENDSLINILGLRGKINNLEGFLFPDTYYLPLDVDEKKLVEMFFDEFRKRVLNNGEISKSLKKKNSGLLKTLTLASIIQGETRMTVEMPTISGVYHNRLKKRMKLEADPTIQYVLPDGPKVKLKYSDLKIDSPYNTYKYYGLPPGPINNPGLLAIMAALNPEENNFIFFVATGKGGHNFSETYGEHLKKIEEYKKQLNATEQ